MDYKSIRTFVDILLVAEEIHLGCADLSLSRKRRRKTTLRTIKKKDQKAGVFDIGYVKFIYI